MQSHSVLSVYAKPHFDYLVGFFPGQICKEKVGWPWETTDKLARLVYELIVIINFCMANFNGKLRSIHEIALLLNVAPTTVYTL